MSYTVSDFRRDVRAPLWAPGVDYLLTADGACLCFDCAFAHRRDIAEAIRDDATSSGWRVVSCQNTYNDEGDVSCDVCGDDLCTVDDTDTDEYADHPEDYERAYGPHARAQRFGGRA